MKRWLPVVFALMATLPWPPPAQAQQRAQYEKLVAKHARANLVPDALVHRVIVRESKYRPDLVGRGGTIGLMQIKLATARGLGYTGDAEGLREPDTNLTYGVKYLAGAYRAANGDHDRAVHYYASGYYEVAKRQRLEQRLAKQAGPVLASAPPKESVKPEQAATPEQATKPEDATKPEQAAKPEAAVTKADESTKPTEAVAASKASKESAVPQTAAVKPKAAAARPKKAAGKKLAEARELVPRPPANIPAGANTHHPR